MIDNVQPRKSRAEEMRKVHYKVVKKGSAPAKNETWDGAYWGDVKALSVDKFHSKSSDHRPVTKCKVAHSGRKIHIFFRVEDRYVRCVSTKPQDSVCRDSCVEFFVMPENPGGFYFNFEVNACGVILLYFVEDPSRQQRGPMKKTTPVSPEWIDRIKIERSLPDAAIDPELVGPRVWEIRYTVPVELFEAYLKKDFGELSGQTWRANFYKCGDQTSHPHWASWADVGEPLNFHKPENFQPIEF